MSLSCIYVIKVFVTNVTVIAMHATVFVMHITVRAFVMHNIVSRTPKFYGKRDYFDFEFDNSEWRYSLFFIFCVYILAMVFSLDARR